MTPSCSGLDRRPDKPFLDSAPAAVLLQCARPAHAAHRIKGKYPIELLDSDYFLAPIPWEADAFYAQPGMAERGLSLDVWPVGTGPYMMTEYIKDRRHVMQRNPNYRGEPYPCEGTPADRAAGMLDDCGKPTPFVDRIVSTVEREAVPQRGKFRQGYYDIEVFERTDTGMDYLVAMQDSEDVRAEYLDKGFRLNKGSDVNSYFIGFNMLDPVIGDGPDGEVRAEQSARNRKLRQAISIAIAGEYAKVFPKKAGDTAQSPLPPGITTSREGTKDGVNPITHVWQDGRAVRRPIADAQQLMVEAGYPNGRDAGTGRPLVLNYDFYAAATPDATRNRLGGAPIRQDRHPARGACHRQHQFQDKGARQVPGVLARLETPTTPTPRTSCSCCTGRPARPSSTARTPRTTPAPSSTACSCR